MVLGFPTLTWVMYPVPIPCQLDHSYAMEVYISWALFRIKVALIESHNVSFATVRSLRGDISQTLETYIIHPLMYSYDLPGMHGPA